MITLNDFDSNVPFLAQLNEAGAEPVTIVNTFLAPEGRVQDVIEIWRQDSEIMKAKPGFISAQLHRGTADSRVLTNVAVWESTKALQEAFVSPDFQAVLPTYPDGSVAYPHLVRPVAVPGICLGAPWDSAAVGVQDADESAVPAIEFFELTPELPVANQLASTESDFTLLDVLVAPVGKVEQAIAAYQQTGAFMKQQPGFIEAQLFRGISGSRVLINLAVWESGKALFDAVSDPGFAAVTAAYPVGSRCTRHALRRVAVPGMCVA
ncbi:antibiotic biosynthesis monooxygenase family protein [Nocardia pseudovaccinii]|uniref:antibiotic biosynthesis monooxygenase family protein n=1 Tax=Nocardia pseudovaccinii TaxID=189540 RepID=UPI0007A48FB4|nr:antibiotic biosynthesis monooxygenase [Nocardia pseudovaccinii]